MTTADKARLSEIKARLKAATPGPWFHDMGNWEIESQHDDYYRMTVCGINNDRTGVDGQRHPLECSADAELIANAPSDLTFALEMIERMRSIDKTDHRYQPMKYQIVELEQERDALKAEINRLTYELDKSQYSHVRHFSNMVNERDQLKEEVEDLNEANNRLLDQIKGEANLKQASFKAGWDAAMKAVADKEKVEVSSRGILHERQRAESILVEALEDIAHDTCNSMKAHNEDAKAALKTWRGEE